jgi:hypothetical protein
MRQLGQIHRLIDRYDLAFCPVICGRIRLRISLSLSCAIFRKVAR